MKQEDPPRCSRCGDPLEAGTGLRIHRCFACVVEIVRSAPRQTSDQEAGHHAER